MPMSFSAGFADVLELYKNDTDLVKNDVQDIQEWALKQPHLPELTELQAILFLQSCYYNVEKAKTAVENYCLAKVGCSDISQGRDPYSHAIQACHRCANIIPLRKTTPEGYLVILAGLNDYNPENFNFPVIIRLLDMVATLYLHLHGPQKGIVLALDMQGSVFGHIIRASNIVFLRKFFHYLQEGIPVRIKGIHWINSKPFLDTFLSLIKPLMKKELRDALYVHTAKSPETFYEFVPRECMPADYGGQDEPIADLREKVKTELMDHADFFAYEEELLLSLDPSKRVGQRMNVNDDFGMDGSFKKLELD